MKDNKLSELISQATEIRSRILKRKMHTCVNDKSLFYSLRTTPEKLHDKNPDKKDLSLLKEINKQILAEIKKP